MRISHKKHFVFLATPRTSSTTVRKVLDQYSDVKSVHITEITSEFPFYHHISAHELKTIFDEKNWEWTSYNKFCMVRNPYDRVVSLYHHYLSLKKDTSATTNNPVLGFDDYVMHLDPTNRLQEPLESFIGDDEGNLLVKDILMYENLGEELPKHLGKLGINIDSKDIPHLNYSKHRLDYRGYYNETTKKKVEEIYAYEINRFEYQF